MSALDRVQYYAFRYGSRVVQLVPASVAGGLGDSAGRLLSKRDSERRRQVARNLRRINPGLSDAELRAGVEATFRNYARYWVELFRLPVLPRPLDAHVTSNGLEHVRASIARGQGTIVALPHLGCFEYAAAWMAEIDIPSVVVAEPLEPREVFEWFVATRERLGIKVVELGPAAGAIVTRALTANQLVGLACDRDLTNDGVEVEFFGETTTMPAGPAMLSLRTGATLIPSAAYFRPDGMHHVDMLDPVEVVRTRGRLRDDITRATQELATRFEELIRAAPEQWFVLQPHWPSDRSPV